MPRFFRKKDEPLFFSTVIARGNVFSKVKTSGNMFPTVITSGNVFPTVLTSGNAFRRDLALETFRNKFSYLNHFIITSKYKFSYW